MKKLIIAMFVLLLSVFGLIACSEKKSDDTNASVEDDFSEDEFSEEDGVFEEQSELTIFANGGVIWLGSENPYDVELSASAIDDDVTFAEAIGEEIHSVEKENAEFDGWTIFAVEEGEWLEEPVAILADGELCVSCGSYGYYLMKNFEIVNKSATTEELLAMKSDGRNFYVLANWK